MQTLSTHQNGWFVERMLIFPIKVRSILSSYNSWMYWKVLSRADYHFSSVSANDAVKQKRQQLLYRTWWPVQCMMDSVLVYTYVHTYVHALKTHDTTVIDNQEEQQEHRMRQRKERGLRQQRSETSWIGNITFFVSKQGKEKATVPKLPSKGSTWTRMSLPQKTKNLMRSWGKPCWNLDSKKNKIVTEEVMM